MGSIEALLKGVSGQPDRMARLARVLLSKGLDEHARTLCTQAVALAPDDAEVHALAAEVLRGSVPFWFFHMVRDHKRHVAYEDAMRQFIKPGSSVLDIGTGTGLLAMMAARMGAARVTTCEKNPAVAAVASEIIAKNGFSDRIRVIARDVEDLEIGVDLSEPADAIVCDVLSNNLIGAGVLPALEQCVNRLARSGAPIIPASGVIRIALAEDKRLKLRQMHAVEGFDLSPFNQLAVPHYAIRINDENLQLRSKPADIFDFDFQSGGPFPQARASTTLTASPGAINGIVQWNYFRMGGEGSYENRPSIDSFSAFDAMFYPLMHPLVLNEGEALKISGSHDRQSVQIWVNHTR